MITLEHVTKKYGNRTALQDVSIQIGRGRTAGILGRNGAGKTTALNLMTGYFPPDSGRVLIDGTDMMLHPEECKRKIGYLPEGAIACKYVHEIAQKKDIKLPLCNGLFSVLNKECTVDEFLNKFLNY